MRREWTSVLEKRAHQHKLNVNWSLLTCTVNHSSIIIHLLQALALISHQFAQCFVQLFAYTHRAQEFYTCLPFSFCILNWNSDVLTLTALMPPFQEIMMDIIQWKRDKYKINFPKTAMKHFCRYHYYFYSYFHFLQIWYDLREFFWLLFLLSVR